MAHGWIKSRFFRAGAVDEAALGAGAVTAAKLDEGIERVARVTVTSAEVLALNATPIELVAAPGAGQALIFEGAQLHLDYNSAAYAGIAAGEDLAISYTGGAQVAEIEATGFLDQTADEYRWAYPAANTGAVLPSVTPTANAALELSMLVGEVITGDSPVIVEVRYRTVTLSLA